ncbi:MAG: radical SAM protein [Acetatifactor sp.]|nr:radical SAM protein [Acetatifactor sp.]
MEKLEFASLDVTYGCNFNCLHCFNSSGKKKSFQREMTDEEAVGIAADLAKYEPMSICVCGGETLLRKELVYRIGETVKSISPDTSVNLVTNGFLMTEEIADHLKESCFDLIQVSLDGISDETHNWLRGNSEALNHAFKAIEILVAKGFYTGVACAPTKKNLDEIPQIVAKAHDLGIKMFRSQPLMLLGRAKKKLQEYVLDEMDRFILVEMLDEAKSKYKDMEISWGDPIQHIADLQQDGKDVNFVSVNAFGHVILTPYLPIDFGDMKEHMFEEFLNKDYKTINQNAFVRKLLSMIDDANSLDVHEQNSRIPELGIEENIHMDLWGESPDKQAEILMQKYFC